MGTIIEAAATATESALGAVQLAGAAARFCLKRAGRAPAELGLLINAGVYLDNNISEPAIAALIQDDIGANLWQLPGRGPGTFSFDVRNGACGLLTGIYLADGLLASETIKLGMVVAADADPDPGFSQGFGFPAAGGAVLLSAGHQRAGFTAFRFATFPEFAGLFQSEVNWHQAAPDGAGGPGRNVLTVKVAGTYATRAAQCAESVTRELAAASALDLGDVGLLVATASVPGFGGALAKRLGIPAGRVASLPGSLAGVHTAAPAVALEAADLAAAGTTVFVSAGAGITVAAALYRA
jgi:3-oxoacyl-[acyl-carrier-protein] synthase III